MTNDTLQAFEALGAEAAIETRGNRFEIDVREISGAEGFALTYPWSDVITTEVMDIKPRLRHLVLDVTGWRLPISGRYLCGHDEQHWFVASLPFNRRTATVRGAMEALKPDIVRREQRRKGVKHRRHRRRTAAYVRQGEWFFLPRPSMHVGDLAERNGQLVREGGKPHRVEWVYRPAGRDETFVRGAVSHPDHETIRLQAWHRVVLNNESTPSAEAQPFTRMAYLD
ncbi:hypothetical protein KOR34_15600 [Posidoniimonas corsicana]|uniref:Uncharacterized protein n=1 Tax=Posidoniimonas corsicana TaxID=1938618 RepID=A0A5C5VF92_9BACT|nr:hypothetical protein [Posidoniimonas corsicana]TWT36627.1 hypothetical protein KOR34_15600 [Posidoniimonas corsicana]